MLCRVLVLLVLAHVAAGNPAVLRQFKQVVNADACLKQCMDHLERTDVELAFRKRSNVSDYLLNIENICGMIRGSKACLEGCGVESNPFALKSMNILCEQQPRNVIQQLEKCMIDHGKQINDECVNECGDYEAFNGQVNKITSKLAQTPSTDPRAHYALKKMTSNACMMFKCTERCTVLKTSAKCGTIEDGNDAGGAVRYLMELSFGAHRADLDDMHLTQTFADQLPAECNYMYAPEVLFDERRDRLMVSALNSRKAQQQQEQQPQEQAQPDDVQKQIFVQELKVLAKQERNLDLEAMKLAKELEFGPFNDPKAFVF